MTDTAERTDVITELRAWLEENWDPDITVAEWWERMGTAGWSAPSLPEDSYGRGLSREEAGRISSTISDHGALGAPGGLGLLLAAPTIATHGTPEQKERYVRGIVTGQQAWCQLFSEPGAGSDLAGLQTRAIRDGDEWIVTGQKVWTSGGQHADLGMLLARTDPDVPKHQGITYFVLDMHQPGVEVRPLREMTGRSMFNEVFITEARVPHDAVIGGLNNGWAVANTTLAFERAGLGAGSVASAAGGVATPGTVAGDLPHKAGDYLRAGGRRSAGGMGAGMFAMRGQMLNQMAKAAGKADDRVLRQDLMRLYTLTEIARFMNLRNKELRAVGKEIPGAGNMAKLSMSHILRLTRDVGLRILGPLGTVHGYTSKQRDANASITGSPFAQMMTEMALYSPGPSIYGGTDEIQHNIIGERVLGLPKEPGDDRTVPFRDLRKNA